MAQATQPYLDSKARGLGLAGLAAGGPFQQRRTHSKRLRSFSSRFFLSSFSLPAFEKLFLLLASRCLSPPRSLFPPLRLCVTVSPAFSLPFNVSPHSGASSVACRFSDFIISSPPLPFSVSDSDSLCLSLGVSPSPPLCVCACVCPFCLIFFLSQRLFASVSLRLPLCPPPQCPRPGSQ